MLFLLEQVTERKGKPTEFMPLVASENIEKLKTFLEDKIKQKSRWFGKDTIYTRSMNDKHYQIYTIEVI